MSEKNKIIPFDIAKVEISVSGITAGVCRHQKQLTINPELRTVTCEECGAIIDPFVVVLRWVEDDIRIIRAAHSYREEAANLRKEIKDLERRKRNLKQQVLRQESKQQKILEME